MSFKGGITDYTEHNKMFDHLNLNSANYKFEILNFPT